MGKGKRRAVVKQSECVACGVCMHECKVQAISIFKGCYAVIDHFLCIGCGSCERNCPAGTIEMEAVV